MEQIFVITGTTLVIHMPKEIDHHNSKSICYEADRLIQRRNIRDVWFDFEQVEFMDSSGIGILMGRYKMIRFFGGAVLAVHVSQRIQRILHMSGIDQVMDIYEGVPQYTGQ